MYIYIHTHTHTHIYIYIYIYVCVYTLWYVCIYIHIYIHIYTYIYIYIYVYVYVYIYNKYIYNISGWSLLAMPGSSRPAGGPNIAHTHEHDVYMCMYRYVHFNIQYHTLLVCPYSDSRTDVTIYKQMCILIMA